MANTLRGEVFIYTTRELSTHLGYFCAFRVTMHGCKAALGHCLVPREDPPLLVLDDACQHSYAP